jgi:hypothetical protein
VWGAAISVTEECFDAEAVLMEDCFATSTEEVTTLTDCLDIDGNSLYPDCSSPDVHEEITTTETFYTPLIESKTYTITVLKSITDPSCTSMQVLGDAPTTIVYPNEEGGTLSSGPISGSYFIRGYDPSGTPCETQALLYSLDAWTVRE